MAHPSAYQPCSRARGGWPLTPLHRRYGATCHTSAATWRRWDVPELRVDAAIVNGPLPVMTLFTKTLWRGTPHGFDEALPKGHEDWSFWLQLTRLPLQAGERSRNNNNPRARV